MSPVAPSLLLDGLSRLEEVDQAAAHEEINVVALTAKMNSDYEGKKRVRQGNKDNN